MNDEALSEREIIERVKKGQKAACQWLVARYMKKAYFIALGFVHNEQDALDIAQEGFVKAFRRIASFDARRSFFPWFYEILKNLCLDHLRRKKVKNEIPLDGVRILGTEAEDREMKAAVRKGISQLAFEQKEVVLLRYFQQMSYQEIAEVTGKPVGTVMSSLFYARAKLKEILRRYLGFEKNDRPRRENNGS